MSARLVDAIVEAGRTRWPTIAVAPEAVTRYLARHEEPPRPAHHGDLYLACACSLGDAGALAELDRRYLAALPGQLRHLDPRPEIAAEVGQELRARLLTAPAGAVPRIAGYGGRGPLGGWLRTVAVRLAIDLRRREPSVSVSAPRVDLLVAGHDPELAFLKAQHQDAFRTALHEALAALGDRDRKLLRLHLVTGLSAVRIATIFHVNHSTVSRWLSAATAAILADVRRNLTTRLRLAPGEFESLARLVQSQLDVSLARLLSEGEPADGG
jgi:RNA polymerase sigma-70 factor (ECF subfamily)